jgi:preprotein translocase subunit SecG
MLRTLVMISHVLLAVGLVGLILLQRGKGAEVGTAFGAGASGTVFGARGSASFLTRATAVLATLFFVTSLSLAFLSSRPTAPTSILDRPAQQQPASELPATPPEAPDASSSTPAPESAAPARDETPEQAPPEGSDAGEAQPDASDEDGATPEQ